MARKWGAAIAAADYKTNNHPAAAGAKAKIRRLVLEEIGAGSARVFDAFAGDGAMWRAVWREARDYVGCDLEWYRDEREAFVADNKRVLRAVDLARFTVFDLDAWGSPWEQVLIVAARRKVKAGERLGLVLTEGSSLHLKLGGVPIGLRVMAGVVGVPAGGAGSHAELVDRAIDGLCRRLGARVLRRWEALGKTGAKVRYLGMVLEGLPAPSPPAPERKRKPAPRRAPAVEAVVGV